MPHIHDQYDFVTTIVIVYDGKVLLANHPRYQKWLPVGGHVELNEDPEQALFREIEEETGLQVEILGDKPQARIPGHKFLLTPHYMDAHDANPPHRHISLVYFARAKSPDFTKSDEHEALRWFTRDELHDPIYAVTPPIIFYAEAALDLAA